VVEVDTKNTNLRVDSANLFLSARVESRTPLTVENTAIESGTNGGWVRSDKSVMTSKRAYVAGPVYGKYYIKSKSSVAGTSLYQRIPRVTSVGQSYTAGMWVRSGSATESYSGRLRLLGMGGTTEQVDTNFTVGQEWTYVTATLDIKHPNHKSLRIYLLHDTPGMEVYMDLITLTPNLYVRGSSFEKDASTLNIVPSGTTVTVMSNDALADAGLGFAADGQSSLKVTRTGSSESYIGVDRNFVLIPGQTFHTTVWVRSAIPGTTISGTLILQARKSDLTNEQSEVAFTATDVWQPISVSHTIVSSVMTRLRTEIHLDSPDASLLLDGVIVN
jgi:hypothetical protein